MAGAPVPGFLRHVGSLLHDEFVSVSLPRHLVIQNSRLGILFKVLQVSMASLMTIYCVSGEVWRRPSPAYGLGFSTWSAGRHPAAVLQPYAPHCMDTRSYHFKDSRQRQYTPVGCRPLPPKEASIKNGVGEEVFIATMVQDGTDWQGQGASCGNATRQACEGGGAKVYAASGGSCSCTSSEEYFVQFAEDEHIFLSHGYEADMGGGFVLRGSSLSRKTQAGYPGSLEEREGDMKTIFQKRDGSTCEVGGKSEWSNGETLDGISGTLRELLNCAGVSLDTDPRSLMDVSGLAPHIRSMGLSLELQFNYENSIFGSGVTCHVIVEASPVWTWKQMKDTVQLPTAQGSQTAKHHRQVYGVIITMKATGQFYTFDLVKLVNAFTSLLVMLQVPRYITQFIALYCLGLMSTIYRNAKRAKLNIFEHFHGACARMMLAEIGFRGLMGGQWRGEVAHLPGLTEKRFFRQIKSVFHEHIQNGILQPHELRKMTNVIFSKMDAGKTGTISCSDFIHSCTANDTVDLHSMARFFDDDKKVGFVQSYFDDTDELRRMHTSEVIPQYGSQEGSQDEQEREGTSSTSTLEHRAKAADPTSVAVAVDAQTSRSPTSAAITGPLQVDDVRDLLAHELEDVYRRLKKLEDLNLHHRIKDLQSKVESANVKVAQASRMISNFEDDKAEKEVMVKKLQLDGESKMEGLLSRVQTLEDSTSLMQANLEARTAQLEVSTEPRHESERVRKLFDERLRSVEASSFSRSGRYSPPEQPPPAAAATSPASRPSTKSTPDFIDKEEPVPKVSPTLSKMALPGTRQDAPRPPSTHPCFVKSLSKTTPPGTPAPGASQLRGSSMPAPRTRTPEQQDEPSRTKQL